MKTYPLFIIAYVAMELFSCHSTSTDQSLSGKNLAKIVHRVEFKHRVNKMIPLLTDDFPATVPQKAAAAGQDKHCKSSLRIAAQSWRSDKAFQSFSIPSNKDTCIICNEGTLLKIYSNSFILSNSSTPVDGELIVKVREYYKISDMILAGLSTTAKSDLLETGGMIYVEVENNGQACKIRDGAMIQYGFPNKSAAANMQLFTGQLDEKNRIDWVLTNDLFVYEESSVFIVVEKMPQFVGGESARIKFLTDNIKYPKKAKEEGIRGTVFMSFIINTDGSVSDVKVLRGISRECDLEAIRVVNLMPNWIPGCNNGKRVRVQFTMALKYDLGGNGEEGSTASFEEEAYKDSLVKNLSQDYVRYFLFSSANLGWLNCDRFTQNATPIVYSVALDNSDDINMYIVFHRIKSIMSGVSVGNSMVFRNVPANEDITIFATKVIDSVTYLATKNTVTSIKDKTELMFRPVTYGELKEAIEELNGLN